MPDRYAVWLARDVIGADGPESRRPTCRAS